MTAICGCGRPLITFPDDLEPTCGECRSKPDHCDCDPVAAKPGQAKRTRQPPQQALPQPDEAMFHGVLGEIVKSVDPYTEASQPAVLIHLLAGCGAMIGRGPHMVAGFAKHPPSIWALVVGGTSLGAKGTADMTARTFLSAADDEFIAARLLPALSTGEGLIHQVRDPEMGDDGTVIDAGAPDKRLFVVLPEFRTVMAQAKRDSNTISPTLRLAWDSPWILSVPNRNTPYKATAAHIIMIAHVTPGEFRARIDPAEIAGGLLNRYLIIYSRSSKDLPDEPVYPEDDLRAYGKRLREAINEARGLGEKRVQMTSAARELWKDSYSALKNPTGARSEDEEGIIASAVVRARPHVLRMALTYALLDQRQIVDREHMAAALALWRYSLDSARWLFRAANPDLARLRDFIDEAGAAGRSRDQIANDLFAKHIKKDELDRILAQLGDEYEEFVVPTKGRSRTMFRKGAGEAGKAGKAVTSENTEADDYLSPHRAGKGSDAHTGNSRSASYPANTAFPAPMADADRHGTPANSLTAEPTAGLQPSQPPSDLHPIPAGDGWAPTSLAGASSRWPAGSIGEDANDQGTCARCGADCIRYDEAGSPLCETCRSASLPTVDKPWMITTPSPVTDAPPRPGGTQLSPFA